VKEEQIVKKQEGKFRIIVTNTAGSYDENNKNDVVIDGSHFGVNSAKMAVDAAVKGRIGNDAGIGKNSAGIAGLNILEKVGIPGAAVSSMSAKIGVGMSTWDTGKVSTVNESARKIGVKVGMTTKEAANVMFQSALKKAK
jgi:uncharacterized protein YunC (DUF1805 family)